ncbi:hypothetical protein RhiJN_03585 [Ceratobasidium sp. AG-Ba]|nr:hypothetical protein RhiJN_03585 [Ceratobasidium sp. AG-Ba]QRW04483.1 hypothetical protein RhiLY_03482 [Ceratobasidium sp. AG-Ba]
MPPKPKPAVTARQAQSKSKPTSKHSYVPPELAGLSTRKTWIPASRHKIAEAKFHGKGKSAGHSSDENESGHEDDGNEIAGEDEKGNNGDESDMDGGRDNSEIADESGPQYYGEYRRITNGPITYHRAAQPKAETLTSAK